MNVNIDLEEIATAFEISEMDYMSKFKAVWIFSIPNFSNE